MKKHTEFEIPPHLFDDLGRLQRAHMLSLIYVNIAADDVGDSSILLETKNRILNEILHCVTDEDSSS